MQNAATNPPRFRLIAHTSPAVAPFSSSGSFGGVLVAGAEWQVTPQPIAGPSRRRGRLARLRHCATFGSEIRLIMHSVEALMALTGDTAAPAQRGKPAPALKLNFLSHGTLESRDLVFSRCFYEEFLGSTSSRRARSLFSFDWAAPTPLPSFTARTSAE